MSRLGDVGGRLYRGDVSYDFVGNQKRWYAISGVILVVTIAALFLRPLQLGIEFKGGAEFRVPGATSCSLPDARSTVSSITGTEVVATEIGAGGNRTLRIQTETIKPDQRVAIQNALAKTCGVKADDVNTQSISGSWGRDISKKALQGLIIFLVLVAVYMAIAFREWKMSAAALVALAHDLVITAGVYALSGFEVTPATVTGLLTILGYSLYDTVVVFDKVRENTAGITAGNRYSYSDAANLAVNQTLVRSVNTSLIALLPVAGILFVGAGLLGAGALKDIALALFVGIAAGTYSSIFIATPLLADLKEREPAMRALRKRVAARKAAPAPVPAAAAAAAPVGGSTALVLEDEPADEESSAVAPRPRTQAQRRPGGQRPQQRRGGRKR
ncbi:protein translocase subunit secF [Motilibacter rhizosphaerae]|uniref:Protein-export membrane protein SecF n=1 Tax=Motilibacter rhizosphaerae TaxID=598652 RepID=A0A4Q7NQV8_9ACTN|nr:protein translocase subunit SecF [Motilibacter rhizosphaerae]RZS89437.1 protein translocase subunit secF [Motilibacter rhizosphaerae]